MYPPGIDLLPHYIGDNEKRVEFCYMGWYSATIAADGEVYPCCNFVGAPAKSMGDILREDLETVWRGKRFRRFRDEIRDLAAGPKEPKRRPGSRLVLEPMCVARRDCPFSHYLCSPDFYRNVAGRVRARPARARPLEKVRRFFERFASDV